MKRILMRLTGIGLLTVGAVFFIKAYTNSPYSKSLYYSGPHVDVVAELERQQPVEAGKLRIAKVDTETGLACATIELKSGSGLSFTRYITTRVPTEDGIYSLVFENDKLIGYFPPEATFAERLQNEMQSDDAKLHDLLGLYKAYIQGFLNDTDT